MKHNKKETILDTLPFVIKNDITGFKKSLQNVKEIQDSQLELIILDTCINLSVQKGNLDMLILLLEKAGTLTLLEPLPLLLSAELGFINIVSYFVITHHQDPNIILQSNQPVHQDVKNWITQYQNLKVLNITLNEELPINHIAHNKVKI